ncbi:IQ and ubiquitin-like domain-containing protein [Diachasmimorpha longicaudata]|uniref:IQ and ubiquitin-like domain-containing protein n=1 Tax=Diachasmimorpha longicaudata TaxID=58733 RepID=UPI0030B9097D
MITVMEIEDRTEDKEFLGGWKNVVTGKEYHDSATQTSSWYHVDCEEKPVVVITSTCKYTTVSRDTAIQTYFWPDSGDKLLTPSSASRSRLTSDELRLKAKELFLTRKFSRLEEESAIKIQKFFRACRTRTEISSLARFAVQTRTHPPVSEDLVHLPEGNKFEIVEHRPPKSRSDFEMLRNVVDHWRILENERVDRTLFDSSKMAAKTMILLREIELLRSIERVKMRVRDERRERRNLDYLEILARPEIWRTRDGKTLEVETLRVARARECRDMYRALTEETANRVSMLYTLKKYILGHTCQSSRDLEYLITQELDFSSKKFDSELMGQLRKRVKLAFFKFTLDCCEPRRPCISPEDLRKYCIRCGKLLSLALFTDTTDKALPTCDNCAVIKPSKDPAILYEPYEQMLKDLRKSEVQMGATTGLAFEIGPRVLHHLVNFIWHGKSGISEFDDLFQLRLLRFQSDLEWSPWNSILLTKREAAIHQAMTNPWELYDASLVQRFVLRNLQAKLCFDSLLKIVFKLVINVHGKQTVNTELIFTLFCESTLWLEKNCIVRNVNSAGIFYFDGACKKLAICVVMQNVENSLAAISVFTKVENSHVRAPNSPQEVDCGPIRGPAAAYPIASSPLWSHPSPRAMKRGANKKLPLNNPIVVPQKWWLGGKSLQIESKKVGVKLDSTKPESQFAENSSLSNEILWIFILCLTKFVATSVTRKWSLPEGLQRSIYTVGYRIIYSSEKVEKGFPTILEWSRLDCELIAARVTGVP